MICLSIETTGRHLGFSFYSFDKNGEPRLLRSHFEEAPSRQSELLIPTLERCMKSWKIERRQLSLVVSDTGPGSFTGVRLGLAAARMIAQALVIPCAGVCSLEAMAWEHVRSQPKTLFVPVIPSVPGEVFFAAYRGAKTVAAPAWKTEKALAAFLAVHAEAVRLSEPPHPNAIAQVAIRRFQRKPRSPMFRYENVVPMYLQPSWAERSIRRA